MNYIKVVSTIENPTNEQLIDRQMFAGEVPVLCCPICRHHCTHIQSVYTLLGGDESRGLYRGSHLVARETPYRRDALAVRVTGECGHRWDLVFQQQTGSTFIRIDVLKNEMEPGEELHLERV